MIRWAELYICPPEAFFRMKKYLLPALLLMFAACKNEPSANNQPTEDHAPSAIQYNIVNVYPHDTSSYTQGLEWHNDTLFEGTGREGFSKLMTVDLKSGKPLKTLSLPENIFGEGITVLNNKLYQLTYTTHKVLVYDATTFKQMGEFDWDKEGWGLTNNGKELIISTGDSNLYFVDPETFKVLHIVGVTNNNGPVSMINELEMIDGFVYANLYLTNYIIKIDPANGHVVGQMDLTGILEQTGKTADLQSGDVLNGIAYNKDSQSLYVTGKKWPVLFEMKLN